MGKLETVIYFFPSTQVAASSTALTIKASTREVAHYVLATESTVIGA